MTPTVVAGRPTRSNGNGSRPGRAMKLTLTLQQRNRQWSDPQLKDLVNAELKVVINFEDANGVKMIAVDRDRLGLERKVRASLQ